MRFLSCERRHAAHLIEASAPVPATRLLTCSPVTEVERSATGPPLDLRGWSLRARAVSHAGWRRVAQAPSKWFSSDA